MLQNGVQGQNKQEPPPPILPSGMRRAVYPSETGDIILLWPTVLPAADMEDIERWLDMMKRKIKRSIGPNVKQDGAEKIEIDLK